MSLSLKSRTKKAKSKKRLLQLIASLLILAGLFLLGVYIYWYYTGEKIVDINVPINVSFIPDDVEVVEEEIAEEQIRTHTVPADHPRYLTISQLGVNQARILSVGLDKEGRIGTPVNIYDAAWFNQSGKQEQTKKVIFLDGHNGGPTKDGIFKRLPKLSLGAVIEVERGDGLISKYSVVENYTEPLENFTSDKMQQVLTPINQQETIAIISCTGRWVQAQRTYTDRVVVKATKID
jgi:hypothetical protein